MLQPRETRPLVGADHEQVGLGLARKLGEIRIHASGSSRHADAHLLAAQHSRDPLFEISFQNVWWAWSLVDGAQKFMKPKPAGLFLTTSYEPGEEIARSEPAKLAQPPQRGIGVSGEIHTHEDSQRPVPAHPFLKGRR